MYKWPNRCSQLRYRASAISTTGTLAPVQDYSAVDCCRGGKLILNKKKLLHLKENQSNKRLWGNI
jgi:hypothetical protein